jgi:hypothetical protein
MVKTGTPKVAVKAFGLNVFDLTAWNGRLLAWATAKVKMNITVSADMYAHSPVIVIDLAFLVPDNECFSLPS